ncbi:MAG: hypothetical protein WDW36_006847 [Sanguina aurantia]
MGTPAQAHGHTSPHSLPPPLRNNYWLLRHGRSLANEAEVIVSLLENGIQHKWSLSPTGLLQAQAAVTATAAPAALEADAADAPLCSASLSSSRGAAQLSVAPLASLQQGASTGGIVDSPTPELQPDVLLHYVYTSPFSRTVLTAQTAAGVAGMCTTGSQFRECVDLRERFFGSDLELQPYAAAYGHIWEHDELSAESHPGGGDGESVKDVAARIQLMFQRLEDEHQQGGLNILLVSHGDTLSILQATMTGCGAQLGHHRRFAFETAELRRL